MPHNVIINSWRVIKLPKPYPGTHDEEKWYAQKYLCSCGEEIEDFRITDHLKNAGGQSVSGGGRSQTSQR